MFWKLYNTKSPHKKKVIGILAAFGLFLGNNLGVVVQLQEKGNTPPIHSLSLECTNTNLLHNYLSDNVSNVKYILNAQGCIFSSF